MSMKPTFEGVRTDNSASEPPQSSTSSSGPGRGQKDRLLKVKHDSLFITGNDLFIEATPDGCGDAISVLIVFSGDSDPLWHLSRAEDGTLESVVGVLPQASRQLVTRTLRATGKIVL